MLLSRFMADRRGGVAPMFALALIPVIGLTGAAIDYSRANSVRVGMQSAIDATALAMAKLAPTLTQSQLQTQTNAYFQAMFNHPEAKNIVITPSYTTTGGSQLTIAVSGSMDTTFMNVMGYSSLNIGSTSTVKWGNNRLRVALALDNTGSMASDGKIGCAQDRDRTTCSTQLKNAATTNGDVYVSIIPFSKDVNVGTSQLQRQLDRLGRTMGRQQWHLQATTTWHANTPQQQVKSQARSARRRPGYRTNHNTWNGCVTDRDNSNTTTRATTTPMSSRRAAATPPRSSRPSSTAPARSLMALSYDWTALNTLGRRHDAGRQHQPDDRSRSGPGCRCRRRPFTHPGEGSELHSTAGHHPADRRPEHARTAGTPSQASIDARQQMTCDNIKAAGITLYTIQVNTDGDPTSTSAARIAPSRTARQILDLVDVVEFADQHRVQPDRHQPVEAAHRELASRFTANATKPGRSAGLFSSRGVGQRNRPLRAALAHHETLPRDPCGLSPCQRGSPRGPLERRVLARPV